MAVHPLASMLRLVARGVVAGRGAELPEVPRRKPLIERVHAGVSPALHARYLRATAGEPVAALAGGGVLSPIFPATWETAQTLELFGALDQPLPPGGVVHVEGETVQLRPLALDDQVRCRVELEKAERVRKGIRLTVSARNWTAGGQLCTQSTAVFLARARTPATDAGDDTPKPTPRDGGDPRGGPPAGWDEVIRWTLKGDAGRRYASVSGDWNPIHLWGITARPFGFSRPILHGFCTEAMVAHALIEHRMGGDPAALRRLRIAFRAPLPLPARPRLLVGEGIGAHWFRVVGGDGLVTYAEGTWAGGTAPPRPRLTLVK